MTEQEREAPILQGKLYPATGTRRPLPRPRLDSSGDVLTGIFPVILLLAPAGYGKSTLMAQWHAQLVERGVACAWLSLDEDDNDKVRFMRHLIAALQHASPRLGRRGRRQPRLPRRCKTPAGGAGRRDIATAPAAPRAVPGRPAFRTRPEVLGILDWLVNYAPRTCSRSSAVGRAAAAVERAARPPAVVRARICASCNSTPRRPRSFAESGSAETCRRRIWSGS